MTTATTEIVATKTVTRELPDRYRINATVQLVNHGNPRPYFSATAEMVNKRKLRNLDQGVESCGCLHDEITRYFPELAPVVHVHLSDDRGRPMHAVENALYWAGLSRCHGPDRNALAPDDDYGRRTLETDEHGTWAPETLASHLRVSVDEARSIRDYCVNDETEHYSEAMRFCLKGLEAKWQAEADDALNVIKSI